jgi:hypothetical protein
MSERINVHLPIFSINSRSIIGDARQDRRRVTSNRTGHGGHIHADGGRDHPPAHGVTDETATPRSRPSAGSIGSLNSIGSLGSVLSIGSVGSILSIGSAGSVLSIGSVGSILSIGSAGSVLSIGSLGSVGTTAGRNEIAGRLIEPAATALAFSALLGALATVRR